MPVKKGKQLAIGNVPLGVGQHGRSALLVYRETDKKGDVAVFLQKSGEGVRFDRPRKKLRLLTDRGSLEDVSALSHMHVTPVPEGAFASYVRTKGKKSELVGSISKDLSSWCVKGKIAENVSSAVLAPGIFAHDHHALYIGDDTLTIAETKDFKKWKKTRTSIVGGKIWGALATPAGILVLMDRSKADAGGTLLRIEGFLFASDDPKRLIWSGESFLFEEHMKDTIAEALGAVLIGEDIRLYWIDAAKEIHTVAIPEPFKHPLAVGDAYLKKPHHLNPVLSPDADSHWESVATFNPAALFDGEQVHLLYRAIGHDGMSTVGYATSVDGLSFTDRLTYPIYAARTPSEGTETLPWQHTQEYTSGGGWGGCEDPRITLIDGKVYMTYVAYNGWEAPRVAITSIDFNNFKAGNWKWKQPLLISRPHQVNKNAALFPEKINGQYVLFHRIFPNMLIDFVPDLEFKGKRWLTGEHKIKPRPSFWDSRKLGVGPPPIKTEAGWLVIYQGVDDRDPGRYKMGAMILDLEDPTKVLYRARLPIAVPDAEYENHGHKWGVIYPCGAAVIKGELYIYYGGADMVTCVAHTPLDAFVDNIKKDSLVSLQPEKVVVK